MTAIPVSELTSLIGKDMGHSDWLLVDQERVNQFAECTGDHQFIHIDEEKAKQTPFGGTIAHGFLSLSLVPTLSAGLLPRPEGLKMAVNYGMDSLRFIQPVRVGPLPPHLAGVIMINVNVQQLAVEAALTGKREHVYHAAMLDPHTAAELSLDQIWNLVDDLLEAHGSWVPKLN